MYMSWAARRRAFYILGFLCILGALVSAPVYSFLKTPPTCFDGIQNGLETNLDRGGSCVVLDETLLIPLTVQWTRPFEVQEGMYNAVGYIENPNENAGIRALNYEVRLYDAQNILVASRQGKTFVMPGSITPIFEGRIDTGTHVVTRAFLDFDQVQRWERMSDVARVVAIENKVVKDVTQSPRIEAVAHNTSVKPIPNPAFVAVVFDTVGNAFAGSRTVFERLSPDEAHPIVFTWSKPWPLAVGRIDIIPIAEPVFSTEALR